MSTENSGREIYCAINHTLPIPKYFYWFAKSASPINHLLSPISTNLLFTFCDLCPSNGQSSVQEYILSIDLDTSCKNKNAIVALSKGGHRIMSFMTDLITSGSNFYFCNSLLGLNWLNSNLFPDEFLRNLNFGFLVISACSESKI